MGGPPSHSPKETLLFFGLGILRMCYEHADVLLLTYKCLHAYISRNLLLYCFSCVWSLLRLTLNYLMERHIKHTFTILSMTYMMYT